MPMVAKIHIIGGKDVLKGVIEVNTRLSILVQEQIMKRVPLMTMKGQIDIIDAQVVRSIGEQTKALELMKSYNLRGDTDARLWNTITGAHKFETDQIAECQKQRTALQTDLSLKQVAFVKECIQGIHSLSPFFTPVVVAFREELGIPIDQKFYADTVQAAQENLLKTLDRVLAEASAMMTPTEAQANAAR
jgi:hypothetical protein